MSYPHYLLDTHAFYDWSTRQNVSEYFWNFFNEQNEKKTVFVSSVTFWEIGLLHKSKKIKLENLEKWVTNVIDESRVQIIEPTIHNMIQSTLLPPHHKDPFDRLLIAQAMQLNCSFVTKDKIVPQYGIKTFWPD